MSVRLVANVLDYVHGIPHGAKLVLLCLADYADDQGKCWPSFQRLSDRCDMSRRHVIRVVADLEEWGLVSRLEERPYKPTIYGLRIPTSDTHVTAKPTEVVTPTPLVTPTSLVTPMSPPSDTHVTTTSDIAMSPKPPINHQETVISRKAAKTPIPDPFMVTEEMYAWAAAQGLGRRQVDADTEQFVDYHQGKDSRQVNWVATWRTWMRNTKRWGSVLTNEQINRGVPA